MSHKPGNLRVSSPAFGPLERIPLRYTAESENISPPIEWSGVPEGTKEFALSCFDPDAPLPDGVTHWLLYGIPPGVSKLAEGQMAGAFTGGLNIAGKAGYTGPHPPVGHGVHHYYFWVYALDSQLRLKPGLNRQQLVDAVKSHVLEQARLVGTYER